MDKILSIDPSGTGTSGICLISDKLVEFQQFQGKDWKEHYNFIVSLVKVYEPNIFLYEDTNYIHKKTKDGLSLFRLLGALECLKTEQVKSVNVLKVKALTKKLLKGEVKIAQIEYQPGRGKGWMFKGKRVSIHQLESFLVYYLSQQDLNNPSLIIRVGKMSSISGK